ncbi:putative leucine--tRNA ligase-like protein, partial [Dinothrombium tinctorium]
IINKSEDELHNTFEAFLINESASKSTELKEKVLEICKNNPHLGGHVASKKFRDWVVSRQRYWGTPIPAVHCVNCGIQPIQENELPVLLPELKDFHNLRKQSAFDEICGRLKSIAPSEWLNVKCPKCNHDSIRETDTLDTFFDSSWYYLRYASEPTDKVPFDAEKVKKPIWLYIGGVEHITGHLLLARFIHHFLRTQKLLQPETSEPFNSIFLQQIVTGKTYKLNGKYLKNDNVKRMLAEQSIRKEDLTITYEKMSKSKGNGVDPLLLVESYGIDATRLSVIGFQRADKVRVWEDDEEEFDKPLDFIRRAILLIDQFIYLRKVVNESKRAPNVKRFPIVNVVSEDHYNNKLSEIMKMRSKFVDEVTRYNDKVIDTGEVTNVLYDYLKLLSKRVLMKEIGLSVQFEPCLADFIIMISPFTPHLAEECWKGFISFANPSLRENYDFSKLACEQVWPKVDEKYQEQSIDTMSVKERKKLLKKEKKQKKMKEKKRVDNSD